MNKLFLASALAALLVPAAQAAETLRVCAADDDLPFTNARGEGFEDKLASVLAESLGMKVERVGFPDPRYMVRDGIDKDRCDVMLGVDTSDPRLQTTSPYYTSSYVFLTRAQAQVDVRDWSSPVLGMARLGVVPGTPAEAMLTQIGRHADTFRYMMSLGGNKSMRNRFVKYDVEKLVRDVSTGEIDIAVAWAPSVARYVKSSGVKLNATPVPDARKSNGERVVFTYDTSIGIKKGNTGLHSRIETALPKLRARFDEVLASEGVTALGSNAARVATTSPSNFNPMTPNAPGSATR